MRLVNDPKIEDLPLVGSGPGAVVALRTRCGEAFRWVPGSDLVALVEFVGPSMVLVAGELYERQGDHLVRVDVKQFAGPLVVVRPPAGDVFFVEPDKLTQYYARVVAPPDLSVELDQQRAAFEVLVADYRDAASEASVLSDRCVQLEADLAAALEEIEEWRNPTVLPTSGSSNGMTAELAAEWHAANPGVYDGPAAGSAGGGGVVAAVGEGVSVVGHVDAPAAPAGVAEVEAVQGPFEPPAIVAASHTGGSGSAKGRAKR